MVVANGESLNISHIGDGCLVAGENKLKLDNMLCVPTIAKNLVSISRLTKDNNVFINFHDGYYLIKDKGMSQTI